MARPVPDSSVNGGRCSGDRRGRDARDARFPVQFVRSHAQRSCCCWCRERCGGSSSSGDRDAGIDTRSSGSGGLIIPVEWREARHGGVPDVRGCAWVLDGGAGAGDGGAVAMEPSGWAEPSEAAAGSGEGWSVETRARRYRRRCR